jgi:hypothetical protein
VIVAAYSLPRGVARDRTRLKAALFEGAGPEPSVLTERVADLEAKLRSVEQHPGIDRGAFRAAVAHTRLVCTPRGYTFADVETPPPVVGSSVEHGGELYTVWRIGPSPLPGDSRRCVILMP